jgi:hypothetical protein
MLNEGSIVVYPPPGGGSLLLLLLLIILNLLTQYIYWLHFSGVNRIAIFYCKELVPFTSVFPFEVCAFMGRGKRDWKEKEKQEIGANIISEEDTRSYVDSSAHYTILV